MRGNKLWDGHRIVFPEMREKVVHRCRECRFLVAIAEQEEIRQGCVAGTSFATLRQRVPEQILLRDLLEMVDRDGLQKILKCNNPAV